VFSQPLYRLSITTAAGCGLVGSLKLLCDRIRGSGSSDWAWISHQYSVRYRRSASRARSAAGAGSRRRERSAVPLSLAAMATAAGFLSFLPTDYKAFRNRQDRRGRDARRLPDQHHRAAGLLRLLQSSRRRRSRRYAFLAPVDDFLERHRVIIIAGTLLIAVAGLPLLYFPAVDSTRSICAVPRLSRSRHSWI